LEQEKIKELSIIKNFNIYKKQYLYKIFNLSYWSLEI